MPAPSLLEDEAIDGIVTALKKTSNGLWSDLGNWASLHEKLRKDENGNAAVEGVKFFECSNCVVHAEDAKNKRIFILRTDIGDILVQKAPACTIQTQAEAVRELFGGKKATVFGWLDTGDKMRLAA